MSFVWGDENINYLTKRYAALQQSTLFQGMQFSTSQQQIKQWAPLIIEGRDPNQKVAATWTPLGTDVNFGEIKQQLIANLRKKPRFSLQLATEVTGLKQDADNHWIVTLRNRHSGKNTPN